MSNRTLKRTGRVGVALAVGFAFAAVPVAAQASPVNLATASPFVVLGGSTVTNTGPSVLNGELGLAPGTDLSHMGAAVVNGATHDNDAVAGQAQLDLTTAYNTAAGQPATDLTGQDLGLQLPLTAGAYKYSSSAQLTGTLVLNAQGDPNAQFVFEIGTQLTTASASRVELINGASPCNVYWQVGSSAVLGSTTAFKGNVMADQSISVNNGSNVQGRLLARIGQVSLINDVIDGSMCGTDTTPTPTPTPTGGGGTGATPPASGTTTRTHNGTARLLRPRATAASRRPGGPAACTAGFHATVHGHLIKRVVFSLDGKRIANRTRPAFHVYVHASSSGKHTIKARVSFKDATHAKTLRFRYRACAAAALRPHQGPSQFTG